jgi:hypothetical protein
LFVIAEIREREREQGYETTASSLDGVIKNLRLYHRIRGYLEIMSIGTGARLASLS